MLLTQHMHGNFIWIRTIPDAKMSNKLSDSDLRLKLLQLGHTPGPITDTTRGLYLRKLDALSQAKPTSHAPPKQSKPVHDVPSRIVSRGPSTDQHSDQLRPATPPLDDKQPPNYSVLYPKQQHPGDRNLPESDPHAVVSNLISTFNDPTTPVNDTGVVFQDGSVMFLSRAVLASQCHKLTQFLYNTEDPFPVTVATLTGRSSLFYVRPSEHVIDLKEKLSLSQAIPVSEQRLVHLNNELMDSATIASCRIESGSTIHLVLVTTNTPTANPISLLCNTPCLSIGHLRVGLGLERLDTLNGSLVTPHTTLPSHTSHILHIYDIPREGFELFVKWLYSRQLDNEGDMGRLVVCYILSVYFDLSVLSQLCLSHVSNTLTVALATELLTYADTVQCQPLRELCVQMVQNTKHAT